MTDIKHLHKVINGEITGRQVGKTYARMHQLAGYVETAEYSGLKQIICVWTSRYDKDYIFSMLRYVFKEHNLTFKVILAHNKVDCNGVVIRFMTEDEVWRKTRGIKNYMVFPVRHED